MATTTTTTSSTTTTSTTSSSSTTTTTTMLPLATSSDFINGPLKDLGRIDIKREAVTKVLGNISGDETISYGTGSYLKGVFLKKTNQYKWEKEGLIANADAYLMVKPTETVTRDDKITVDNEVYLIDKVIIRKFRNTNMLKSCVLIKYDTGTVGT